MNMIAIVPKMTLQWNVSCFVISKLDQWQSVQARMCEEQIIGLNVANAYHHLHVKDTYNILDIFETLSNIFLF